MQIPATLLQSLQLVKGYDSKAFVNVHEQPELITSIRFNPLKDGQALNQDHPFLDIDAPVPWSSHGYYLQSRPSFTLDPLFHAGLYYVQEASSMFLEQAIQQTTDTTQPLLVLDLCAAPGGKSTLLQSIISKDSLLVSNEVIQSRVNVLKENIIKWGCSNVVVTNNDPRDFSKLTGLFDVVVIDAPCSGSGLFRRDAAAVEEWSPANVQLCSQRQQRIIADAWHCLKDGGVLIYSTCSYSPEEDEEILDWLIHEFSAAPVQLQLNAAWNIDEVVTASKGFGYRFWPYKLRGEGFFLAVCSKQQATTAANMKIRKAAVPSKEAIKSASAWLADAAGWSFVLQGQNIAIVPEPWQATVQLLMQELKVRYAGTELGTIAKADLLPEHALALSTVASKSIVTVDLDEPQALQFLRKQELQLSNNHKGWALARYRQQHLGWMKLLGNRINNYYPKEYRILK